MKKHPFIIAGLAAVILVAFAQLLGPLAVVHYANKKIARIGAYSGHIGNITIHLWRGAYTVEDITVVKMNGKIPAPYFEAKKIDFSVQWKTLILHRSVVADVNLESPKINFVTDPDPSKEQLLVKNSDWKERLKEMTPLRVNRLTVHNGEIHFRNYSAEPKIDIYLHAIEAEVNNLSNTKEIDQTLKSSIRATGKAMTKGTFEIFLAMDPFAAKPTFETRAKSTVFFPELNDFFRHYLAVEAKDGQIEIYIEGTAADGEFNGYVKPLIEGLTVLQIKSDTIGETIKGVFAKIAAAIFKNQEKKDLATKVEISGSFDDPKVNAWGALSMFVKNAFYKAVLPGFEGAARIPVDLRKLTTP